MHVVYGNALILLLGKCHTAFLTFCLPRKKRSKEQLVKDLVINNTINTKMSFTTVVVILIATTHAWHVLQVPPPLAFLKCAL